MKSVPINLAAATAMIAACAAVAILAAGCSDGPSEAPAVTTTTALAAAAAAPASVATPLIADDGSLMPSVPQSEPADPGARTRAGRYATPQQAAQLEQALQDSVVRIDAQDVGRLGVDTVAAIVHGLQASQNLGRDAPVLVQGQDLRLAAALADKLADDGLTHVWLVTR